MVDRDRELARVTGLLDEALAGRRRLVLCAAVRQWGGRGISSR
jgi:hypothetical protein